MNIELNNEGKVHSFDVDGNKTADYLHEIAMKVFELQRNTFILQLKDRSLPKSNIRLQELFGLLEGTIAINIKVTDQNSCQLPSICPSLPSTTNIKCICKNNSITFCPTCDSFFCSKCLFNHSSLHEVIHLDKSTQNIMVYQKNLLSKLNNITKIYNNSQQTISENNDNIVTLLDQSTYNIMKIKERYQVILSNFKHEKIIKEDALLESIKKKMLDLNNNNNSSNNNSTTSTNMTDQSLYDTMKGFSGMNNQLKELENQVDPLRQLVNYQTHVIEYLMMISKSVNDLLNQLMIISKPNNLTKDSYISFIEKITIFVNTHTELVDTSKIKHHSNIASMMTDYTLSPPITNPNNSHEQLSIKPVIGSLPKKTPLTTNKKIYKPVYTIQDESLSQAYNHIKKNLIDHMKNTGNYSRNNNKTEGNIPKADLQKATFNKNFKSNMALSNSNPCVFDTFTSRINNKTPNHPITIQDPKKKEVKNKFRSSLKNHNLPVESDHNMKKIEINTNNPMFSSSCLVYSQPKEPLATTSLIDNKSKIYSKQKSISMNVPTVFIRSEALDVLANLKKVPYRKKSTMKVQINSTEFDENDSDRSPNVSLTRKSTLHKESTKGLQRGKQSFFIPDRQSIDPQIAMITRKAKSKNKKKKITNIYDFLI